ncbi:TRAP transporter small permease [Pseudogracilibacillus sp. SE30717A]|uniref:TRAP transporter small permease n=1 Tax=Pseudogracilibacillus sp. SE30717A TaxID=3098293 RepID=UPI00300DF12A
MKIFYKTEEAFVGISMMAVTLLLFVNIVLRFFFSAGISWTEELVRYTIIWITFIGASICFRRGIHVGIDVLIDYLPEKGKKILSLIINIMAIALMICLIKYGSDLVMFSMNSGQLTPALQIKMFWVYLAIPIGALLSLIHLVIQTYEMIRNFKTS